MIRAAKIVARNIATVVAALLAAAVAVPFAALLLLASALIAAAMCCAAQWRELETFEESLRRIEKQLNWRKHV